MKRNDLAFRDRRLEEANHDPHSGPIGKPVKDLTRKQREWIAFLSFLGARYPGANCGQAGHPLDRSTEPPVSFDAWRAMGKPEK